MTFVAEPVAESERGEANGVSLRRAVLMTPGNVDRLIAAARETDVDAVWLDLEEAVPDADKAGARQTVADALDGPWRCRELLVRINGVSEGGLDDVDVVLSRAIERGRLPDGFVLTKVDTPDEVRIVGERLAAICAPLGLRPPRLWSMIETLPALRNLDDILAAHDSLTAVLFGAGALRPLLGMPQASANADPDPLDYLRVQVVAASRARGLTVIDGACSATRDAVATERAARHSFLLGFDGAMVLSPRQIGSVIQAWAPSESEVEEARTTLARLSAADDVTVTRVGSRTVVVEMARLQALTVLARAEQSGSAVTEGQR